MPRNIAKRMTTVRKITPRPSENGKFVRGLARGLSVLHAFDLADKSLTNQEIARRIELTEPTVTRLVHTLTALGYLERTPDGNGYRLAPLAASLGYTAMSQNAVRRVARPLMQQLADTIGAEVGLACRDGLGILYLENCRSISPYQLHIVSGTRLPVEITVSGHCFLAAISEAERAHLMGQIQLRHGEEWSVLKQRIDASVEQVMERAYCVAEEEWGMALSSLATPLILEDGQAPYVLDCSGPAAMFPQRRMIEEIAPQMLTLAQFIRTDLTGRSNPRDIGPV